MIHVDFTSKHSDMFWVSLALDKYRLAIGVAILALFCGGLICFFSMIGELRLLLQLSPMFIGFPALAIAGQLLRLHANCRKFIKSLPESQRRVQYMFQENSEGYDVVRGGSFSHILWQDLMSFVELRDYFVIYINAFDCRIVPKSGFHNPLDVPLLRRIVRSKLGTRAKLLST
jgi:hypothetical protein